MHCTHRSFLFAFVAAAAAAPLCAQELRRGLGDADAVAVARQVGMQQPTPDVAVHRLQIAAPVRGVPADAPAVSVIDWPGLSLHNQPAPGQLPLYCLQDATREAQRLGLPTDQGPYFRMSGWPGSNPPVGAAVDADPCVRFARLCAALDAGTAPAADAAALAATALGESHELRLEATRLLA